MSIKITCKDCGAVTEVAKFFECPKCGVEIDKKQTSIYYCCFEYNLPNNKPIQKYATIEVKNINEISKDIEPAKTVSISIYCVE